jgi:hypothetical protein
MLARDSKLPPSSRTFVGVIGPAGIISTAPLAQTSTGMRTIATRAAISVAVVPTERCFEGKKESFLGKFSVIQLCHV